MRRGLVEPWCSSPKVAGGKAGAVCSSSLRLLTGVSGFISKAPGGAIRRDRRVGVGRSGLTGWDALRAVPQLLCPSQNCEVQLFIRKSCAKIHSRWVYLLWNCFNRPRFRRIRSARREFSTHGIATSAANVDFDWCGKTPFGSATLQGVMRASAEGLSAFQTCSRESAMASSERERSRLRRMPDSTA